MCAEDFSGSGIVLVPGLLSLNKSKHMLIGILFKKNQWKFTTSLSSVSVSFQWHGDSLLARLIIAVGFKGTAERFLLETLSDNHESVSVYLCMANTSARVAEMALPDAFVNISPHQNRKHGALWRLSHSFSVNIPPASKQNLRSK